ncbi:site-2 protease family protein [Thioalkalivibrio denitrificans]|uniref:Site-2 protease family protein n=1 Tax=Thioalkalivibrio denitrificans TaxID=108003 RepID=A0A1V3NLK1_9GAMM|nr:site-2 protease family protein [Thioalkalivibrio denitrificans]OOG25945.1 site-2 protease family protein [Thioalkalivibrio denitrificans]
METIIQNIAIWAIPVLFAITLHEVAHGWVARLLGDTTAQMLGRLTVNPLKHIDPVGTVLVPLGLLVITMVTPGPPFVFGWAKPVPVNTRNLKNPQRDMAIVAVAGPLSNLVMAFFWALMIKLGLGMLETFSWMAVPLVLMGAAGVFINLLLMVLNLLPVPPLDGGRVVSGLLPPRMSDTYDRLEPYGLFIILGLLFTGLLWTILRPFLGFFIDLIGTVFGLPGNFLAPLFAG